MTEAISKIIGSSQTQIGSSGADIIAASDKMIFDWVREPGDSHTTQWYGADWNVPVTRREGWEAYYEYHDHTWHEKGSATGIAVFHTLSPAQASTAMPSEFNLTGRWPYNSLFENDLTKTSKENAGWNWNPVSGIIDP